MSDWQDIDKAEQQNILERICEIYKEHEYPSWLSHPKIVT
jgi:hypothetical protein